jgi:hypothetical protein
MQDSQTKKGTPVEMPQNFINVITDFTTDLSTTFPEYKYLWDKWTDKSATIREYEELFEFCMKAYPERFFDILYQNEEIFEPTSETNTLFLPMVEFKMLFHCENITPTIKQTMWKYLQLVLVTVISCVKNKADFGESSNIFEGIDETELQTKLNETILGLGDFFKQFDESNPSSNEGVDPDADNEAPNLADPADFAKQFFGKGTSNEGSFPNPDDLHSHIKGLFDGKIGTLAKELAEELTDDLMKSFQDGDTPTTTEGVLKNLMKNPAKMLGLLKTVSSKLDAKMKSGDISQEELMKEAGDLIGKMKEMGGGDKMNDMFKNIMKGMGGKKGAKFDMNAFTRMASKNSHIDRMKAKLDAKRQTGIIEPTDKPNNFVFKVEGDEGQQKSAIPPPTVSPATDDWLDSEPSAPSENKKKKSSGKKGKSKK